MLNYVQDNWWLALIFPSAATIIIGMIAKFVSEKKLLKITLPIAEKTAQAISIFLRTQIGVKAANKFENGLVITICRVLRKTIQKFEEKLVSDNTNK